MANRLDLSPETLASLKQDLTQVLSESRFFTEMPESFKLDFGSRWSPWYTKFRPNAYRIGSYMREYFDNGPIHETLDPLYQQITDQLLLFSVSAGLLDRVHRLGLTGWSALEELKKITTPTLFQSMQLIDELVNSPYDGSTNIMSLMSSKCQIADDLLAMTTDPREIMGLLCLYSLRQRKLVQHLTIVPTSLDHKKLLYELPEICSRVNIPLSDPPSTLRK